MRRDEQSATRRHRRGPGHSLVKPTTPLRRLYFPQRQVQPLAKGQKTTVNSEPDDVPLRAQQLVAAARVPDAGGSIPRSRGQHLSLGMELHVDHRGLMPLARDLSSARLANLHELDVRVGTRRDPVAVRSPRQGSGSQLRPLEADLAGLRVADFQRFSHRANRNLRSTGTELHNAQGVAAGKSP